jgi:ketosteroid isomerase-like protein
LTSLAGLPLLYADAARRKDVEGFLRLYDDDARIFDAWNTWQYVDKRTWREAVKEWFSSLGTHTVKVTFDAVQIFEEGALGSLSALVTYAGLSAEDQEVRSIRNRLSWIVRRYNGNWRIHHEHTSVPIDFETMCAIAVAPK